VRFAQKKSRVSAALHAVVPCLFFAYFSKAILLFGVQFWLWRAFGVAHFIERLAAEPEANRVCRGRTFAV
jgi:hypothetical protein